MGRRVSTSGVLRPSPRCSSWRPAGNETARSAVEQPMRLNEAAREFIGEGLDATLVTLKAGGSAQATGVWGGVETAPDGAEPVCAPLADYKKTRNIRREPRVAVTIVKPPPGQQGPYLAITGTARIVEGGAPQLLSKLATVMLGADEHFPPPNSPPGLLTRIRIDKVGGMGPWTS